MFGLLSDPQFYVGSFVILAYQASKFYELSSFDKEKQLLDLGSKAKLLARLRASDFADHKEFLTGLAAFLSASLLGYALLCVAPSELLQGALILFQIDPALVPDPRTYPSYPVYIAAFYVGFSQPGVPVLSKVGTFQRDVFHEWIGVPGRVISTSNRFTLECITNSNGIADLQAQVDRLLSDRWKVAIAPFADVDFYQAQLQILQKQISDPAVRTSEFQLKDLLDALVFASALATVRKKGGRGLGELAELLKVTSPNAPEDAIRALYVPEFLMFVVAAVATWFVVPEIAPAVHGVFSLAPQESYWPATLQLAQRSVMNHVVPIFIGVAIVLYLRPRASLQRYARGWAEFDANFRAHAGILFVACAAVFTFVVLKQFADVASQAKLATDGPGIADPFLVFLGKTAVVHLIQAILAGVVCFFLLIYFGERRAEQRAKMRLRWLAAFSICVALVAAAEARAYTSVVVVGGDDAPDYVLLVIFLNLLAAFTAAVVARMYYTRPDRQALGGPVPPQPEPTPA